MKNANKIVKFSMTNIKSIIIFLILLVIVSVFAFACGAKTGEYGKKFEPNKIIEIQKLISDDAHKTGETVQITGEILKVCPTMGCWFYVKDENNKKVYVDLEMNKYFKVPGIKKGDKVIVSGRLEKDADSTDVTIIADGVIIK